MHGTDYGDPRPDWKTSHRFFINDNRIIRVSGTANGGITSIGFTTSKGTFLGPFGAGGGKTFSVDGLFIGLYGALENGAISGIGVWYTQEDPPFPMSLVMSAAFGNVTNTWTWDDTPDMGGAHIIFPLPHLDDWLVNAGQ